jgi:prevent-host-death family protein
MKATMHEAKTSLSKLVARARAGEEVVLTHGRAQTPVARIVPIEASAPPELKERPIGLFKGQFEIPGSFFEPMTEEELALWEAPIVSTWADNNGTPKDPEK